MAEKQYNKWLDYRKWYEKQKRKGFALSKNSTVWYESYEEYLIQYEYMKKLKAEDAEGWKDKSYYDMIKSRSYSGTSRQTEYFYDRVSGILNDLTERAASGDTHAAETLEDFFAKFGDIRTADKQTIVYQQLKGGDLHYEYHGTNSRGWNGNVMDMMNYFQNTGVIDQIYV